MYFFNSVNPDEIMQHLIWFFTVCQRMHLGAASIERVELFSRFKSLIS